MPKAEITKNNTARFDRGRRISLALFETLSFLSDDKIS